jgi:DNA-binding Lrp family transcriptional regulator
MELDRLDISILKLLAKDGRASHVDIGQSVGLSATACARRIKALEDRSILKGSTITLDLNALGFTTNVIVRIALDSQRAEDLDRFEKAVARCEDVLSCWLMAGVDDYILHVVARDIPDYERIHKQQLSMLPGVARIQSSFALRSIVERGSAERALGMT